MKNIGLRKQKENILILYNDMNKKFYSYYGFIEKDHYFLFFDNKIKFIYFISLLLISFCFFFLLVINYLLCSKWTNISIKSIIYMKISKIIYIY